MGLLNKIDTRIKDYSKSQPYRYAFINFLISVVAVNLIILPLSGIYINPILARYVPSLDHDPPIIEIITPEEDYLTQLSEINVSFAETGGSGLDKNKSIIKLKGPSGIVDGTTISNESTITFKPNQKLDPGSYTFEVRLFNRGGKDSASSKQYNIRENPTLNFNTDRISGGFGQDYYNFTILNNASRYTDILNTDIRIRFSGIIKNWTLNNDEGVENLRFSLIKENENNSCALEVKIAKLSPGSDFRFSVATDSDISNYISYSDCPTEKDILKNQLFGYYGNYKVWYHYSEFGQPYAKSIIYDMTGERKHRNKVLSNPALSDDELKVRSLELAHTMAEFANERIKNEPKLNLKDLNGSKNKFISYFEETDDLYFTRYFSNVTILYEEFIKRDIFDEDLENFYDFPMGGRGIKKVSLILAALTSKIPPGLDDKQLREQAIELSQNISEFVREREKNKPQIDFKDWDNSTDISYSIETNDFYYVLYGPKVAILREEFLKRNITDPELDWSDDNPTNFFGLIKVSFRLAALTVKLPGGLSDDQLKKQAIELSQNISEFIRDRESGEPQIDTKDWDNSTQKSISYSTETRNLYFVRYGLKVTILREEFLKRGIKDEEFERLYEFPVGAHPFQEISLKLSTMANKLPINETVSKIER